MSTERTGGISNSFDTKRLGRAILYPFIYASIGVLATEVIYEAMYAVEFLGITTLHSAVTKEPIDISMYFNNSFRNMYFPELPLLVGEGMTLVGALKAFAEEYLGHEPGYKTLFHGRSG